MSSKFLSAEPGPKKTAGLIENLLLAWHFLRSLPYSGRWDAAPVPWHGGGQGPSLRDSLCFSGTLQGTFLVVDLQEHLREE